MAVLKDYLRLHTIDAYAPYLSDPFVAANFAFHGTALNGTPQNQDLWKRGVTLVTNAMGEEIGKYYVARYFPPEAKAAMDELVQHFLADMAPIGRASCRESVCQSVSISGVTGA